ncbi:Putative phosphoinositide phosphatase [Ceraceosorus bombacis]|uniref:Putative phosphoinositide phosphatase n=1 Tax=Ceraceosorus bombacis TaxID=401625 RepID=A0A0P1BCH7_9BASI|nr:Putative phosphoinositide phosphatase [Ceraceosorus bombacis]
MAAEIPAWQGYTLYIAPESYLFDPIAPKDAGEKKQVLKIERDEEGSITLLDSMPTLTLREKELKVYGILGQITLHTAPYLVLVTARKQVGNLSGHALYQATDFRICPVPRDSKPSVMEHPVERTLLELLKTHLYSAPFYFSYTYDLTSSFQRSESQRGALWQRADERFFWNRYISTRFIETTSSGKTDLSKFILPIIFGFLELKQINIKGNDLTYGLIARRSRHRAGTRYFSRGIDALGEVSNFNESEQFIILNKGGKELRSSYVQTRGSVPVFWAEVNNLRYKPDLLIMDKHETAEATALHFQKQVATYGENYLVNLVNQKGYEKPVKDAYEKAVEELGNPRVHYTYYDFHHECKGMKFEKVFGLIERLQGKGLRAEDYFQSDGGRTTRKQSAVVRTNCMDCLDRTNVVQSTLGRWVLNQQLREVGVLASGEKFEDQKEFWHIFRNVWADHADVVSKAYSGTGALKTDFTRTGKRSWEGALQDGVNSLTRYVRNNFFDGSRQDAYDLFTGAWTPRKGATGDKRAILVRLMPYIWLLSVAVLVAAFLAPRSDDDATRNKITAVAVIVAFTSFYFITERGLEYVAWPTLNRPEETMYYDGPGYSSGRHGRAAISAHYEGNRKGPKSTARDILAEPAKVSKGRRGGEYTQ